MLRRVVAIRLRDGVFDDQVQAYQRVLLDTPDHVPFVLATWLGRNLPDPTEWTFGWDLVFESREAVDAWRIHPYHTERLAPFFVDGPQRIVERISVIDFGPYAGEAPEPGISDFIKRTLAIQVKPGTPADRVKEFEERLTQMPCHIKGIRNWAMSRNPASNQYPTPDGGPIVWTHVWEQEFADDSGIRDYMDSPFHWGVVDLFFDRDGPYNIVERHLHIYYPCGSTILGWTPGK
ncbi:MAG: Dabb family protein [Dehalococcoidia bacterium]